MSPYKSLNSGAVSLNSCFREAGASARNARQSLDVTQVLRRSSGFLEVVVRLKTHPELFRIPKKARERVLADLHGLEKSLSDSNTAPSPIESLVTAVNGISQ